MPTLYLQCNMDRLGPQYEANKPYYLLTLSVAFKDKPTDAADVRKYLRPWIWTIDALSVYKQAAAGGAFTLVSHRVIPAAQLSHVDILKGSLDYELDQQLSDFASSANDFFWDPVSTTPPPPWNGRSGRDWRSWVAHIGSYPGGIGSALNLAFVVIPDVGPATTDLLLAAPEFQIDGVKYKPADPSVAGANKITPVNGMPGTYQWEYESGAIAFLNKPEAPVADPNTFINIETQWRNARPLDGGGNWLEHLDDRLDQAFDGPDRLLDWFNQGSDVNVPIPAGFNELMLRAMFGVVRPVLDSRMTPIHGEQISLLPFKQDSTLPPFTNPTIPANWKQLLNDAIKPGSDIFPTTSDPLSFRQDWSAVLGSFRDPAVLINLVLVLWKEFFETKWTVNLEQALRRDLEALPSLHQFLLSHTAGYTWRALVPDGVNPGQEFAAAKAKVTADLVGFGKSIWDQGDQTWEDKLKALAEKVMLVPDQIPTDQTSDGLLIQVDKVEMDQTGRAGDKQDYLRKLTGVGVLLRRTNGDWRCLNMANVAVWRKADNEYSLVDNGAKAVPYRFSYMAGLRQGFIKYLNQPLVAKSPWSRLSPSRDMRPDGSPIEEGLFEYQSPYKVDTDWVLERLVYGEHYEVAPFYFGNAGTLPQELTAVNGAGKVPWSFVLPPNNVHLPSVSSLPYLRNCNVGSLRIAEAGDFPPELPENVFPIARVLEKEQPGVDTDPNLRHPLLLLLPSDTTVWNTNKGDKERSFSVRPPDLDVKVWDRWIPNDAPGSKTNFDRRRKVIGDLHSLRCDLDAGLRGATDITIDDPAVTGFKLSAKRMWPADNKSFNPPLEPAFTPRGDEGLIGEQKFAVPMLIKSAALPDPKFELVSGKYQLSIPDGEVWQISFTPKLSQVNKLAQSVIDALEPLTLVVEVAKALPQDEPAILTASARLYDGLRLNRQAVSGADALVVSLDGAKFNDFAPLVHRVELVTQRWRWDGRPVYEVPLQTPPRTGLPFSTLGELANFEGDAILFGSREDSDASVYPSQAEFADPDSPAQQTLRTIEWSNKEGVLYYRFAVRVFSRYEGLLKTSNAIDSTTVPKGESPRWKRYARECLWNKTVPKPAVKLVVPLTQTVEAAAGSKGNPGWLVLLEESWYGEAMGGLGEHLRSEIMTVRLPDAADQTRPEFGPDPIITMPEDPYTDYEVTLPPPVGAIGTTFDQVTAAPLFAHTAFYQPPPEIKKDNAVEAQDLSFHFIKLKFQRVLMGTDPQAPRTPRLTSDFTQGYWTQVLPPSEWWSVKANGRVKLDELDFIENQGFVLNGTPATILPTGPEVQPPESYSRFEIFVLVTQAVVDAFGRKGQERFQGLYSLSKLATIIVEEGTIIRLLEVQFRLKANEALPVSDEDNSLTKLVDALFPGPDPQDAKGRIVRVSPPIIPKGTN
ncbi:MAG TPA: hypothetical protein VI306_16245 [Pyrinomonadaceae bacterium]